LSGLATDRLSLYEHGAQPFRRAVDGGAQARRPGPDDDEVVEGQRRCGREAEGSGDLCRRRRLQGASAVRDHQREVLPVAAVGGEEPGRLRVTLELEPLERNLVAGQEVLDGMRRGGPPVADDTDSVVG